MTETEKMTEMESDARGAFREWMDEWKVVNDIHLGCVRDLGVILMWRLDEIEKAQAKRIRKLEAQMTAFEQDVTSRLSPDPLAAHFPLTDDEMLRSSIAQRHAPLAAEDTPSPTPSGGTGGAK